MAAVGCGRRDTLEGVDIRMRKAALHNLGCKVNAYETEAMEQLLEAAGYEIVPFQEVADVYVVNTCSVTNIAERKSRQMLHRARKMNPQAVIVAAGCYVQAAKEALAQDLAIDIIIGNNKKQDLVPVLEDFFCYMDKSGLSWKGDGAPQSDSAGKMQGQNHGRTVKEPVWAEVIPIDRTREYENLNISRVSGHTRAFVKVQDGCNQFCSYCIIPYTRGRVRSRRMEDVEQEVRRLLAAGCQEVVLTGIHLSSYGKDLEDGTGLLDLIGRLHPLKGLKRIRLGSLEPRIVTEKFARSLAGLDKVCPHFHLSLQSGCDETLKRMNRHYTTAEYETCCQILRGAFDRPAITTDVIVGFPGETEGEFEETRKFLERIHFYEMHIFKYSVRAGTRAAVMDGQIPETVKAARSDILLNLERQMSEEYRRSFLGKELEILLEEPVTLDGAAYMTGHTREYVKAAVPCGGAERNTLVTGTADSMLTDEIILCNMLRITF